MAAEEDELFKYLPYVTLREGWTHAKVAFFVWLVLSVLFACFGLLVDFGASKTENFWAVLPTPVWYVLGFAAFSWLLRGEELRIAFPQSFKLWLLITSVVAGIVLAAHFLPTWAMIPVYLAIIAFAASVEELAKIGKENFKRLSEQPGDGA